MKLFSKKIIFLFLIPTLSVVICFKLIPIIYAFILSFYNAPLGMLEGFISFGNYRELLSSKDFYTVLLQTFYFVICALPFEIGIALFFAILLNRQLKGLSLYRTVYFLPVVTSVVAVAIVWKWIFKVDGGLANQFLGLFGSQGLKWLEEPRGIFILMANSLGFSIPSYLEGPSLALVSVIVFSVWKALGYNLIIFMSGLKNIPDELYEAAKIDGASNWQQFRHITLPLLSPTTFYILIMSTIGTFQAFNQIYIMTEGGPIGTTKVIVYYLYEQAFDSHRMGYASAISLVLFVIILTLTLVQRKVAEKRVFYG
ncbi:MAG: sugar ABC transporter permease [Candidatus Coatesbacteria bacterium]|nr:sugar ABC transporter permease [Candidatus Coatesbacteria bacterium]